MRREADTMALYLALSLLVALNIAPDADPPPLLPLIWGTTAGLAAAHWFAFTLVAALVRDPHLRGKTVGMLLSQLVMVFLVALVASAGVVLSPDRAEVLSARVAVALFIAALVTSEALWTGRPLGRALALGAAALGLTLAIATVKLAFP